MQTLRVAGRDEVQRAYERLLEGYRSSRYPTASERIDRLDRLDTLISKRRKEIVAAIDTDFGGRSEHETLLADVMLTLDSVREARGSVATWMKPRPASPNPYFQPSRAFVEHLPLGVVGVISPWNYPVNLALAPVAAALAAGNRVLLKPSELTPRTSALMAAAVRETFSAEEVAVVEGGPDVAASVTRLPLDHLLFTGSTSAGKMVAKAGAENLTSLTLELGGKSPTLVHPDYPLTKAAERIALGKLFNAGQTCIAPDYVMVHRGEESRFARAFGDAVERHYPRLATGGQYSAIVNPRHQQRLRSLLEDARGKGARLETVAPGGEPPAESRIMAPVLAFGVTAEMKLMQEEIFGPILPVLEFESVDAAIEVINARPRPLAFYYFDENADRAMSVLQRTISGGACLNDTLVHFAQENLPFGGVGASGLGSYHGFAGFETFSHARGVLVASPMSAARRLQAPPYGRTLSTALNLLIDGVERIPGARLLRNVLGR